MHLVGTPQRNILRSSAFSARSASAVGSGRRPLRATNTNHARVAKRYCRHHLEGPTRSSEVAMRSSLVIATLTLASTLAAGSPASAQNQTPTTPVTQPARGRDLPLDPARTINIDTDEGSWLSVDVSPDGRTIVFDLLGDLYTMPIAGGDATALTTGMAYDAQPRFSPDGKLIVFTSDRDGGDNVWTIDVATKQTKLITRGKG